MADMNRVIHTETNRQHYVDTADDVDGDVPEVKEANNVQQSEDDGGEDHHRDPHVGEEDEDDGEDGGEGQSDVPQQFVPDDLVGLPGCVDLDEAEGAGEAGLGDDLLHLPLGGDMFLRPVKQQVGEPLLRRLKTTRRILRSQV